MKLSRVLVVLPLLGSAVLSCQPAPATNAPVSELPARPLSTEHQQPPASLKDEPPIDRTECGLPERIRESDWPRTLTPYVREEPDVLADGGFTIAVLPDTQYYASCRERHFPEQGKWIAAQAKPRNIVATIHLGDLTEHNSPKEWDYVHHALTPLFDELPLFLATGNHDYGEEGRANARSTLYSRYFGVPKTKTTATVAAQMKKGDVENAYYRLPLGDVTLGVLVLEWSPTDAAVAWAKDAVAEFPNDRKIFVTHAYLFHDGTRYDYEKRGKDQPWNPLTYGTAKLDPERPFSPQNAAEVGAHDGEMLWTELLKDLPGLFLTLSGHVLGDGAGLLTSVGHRGATVHQVLTNFQMLDEGGLGYLRLIEVAPDGASMRMKTYSPSLDRFATANDQQFSLAIEPPLF